jgi:transcriptional regulator with XRE-family HTH domain
MPTRRPVHEAALLQAFGSRVRQMRLSAGLSQLALADLAGVHPTYLSGIERGLRNVSLINVFALARALDVDPSHLLAVDLAALEAEVDG